VTNLLRRTLSGAVYVAVIFVGTIVHPYLFAFIFSSLLFFLLHEFYSLIKHAGYKPSMVAGLAGGILFFFICFSVAMGFIPSQYGLSFIPILLFLLGLEVFRSNKNTIGNSGFSVFSFVYISAPVSLLNFIVFSSVNGQNSTFYPWILAGVFIILWVNDSFAYLIGTALGKHKMCTHISPGKSWEGFIGGAVFAVVVAILNAVLFQVLSMFSWIVIALLTVGFGTLGDLFESRIKRELGIKDSGKIMPGHGGFLDRFDSLLFAIPAVFIWLILSGGMQ
jgi:phosphatidate cytidylyltransferase